MDLEGRTAHVEQAMENIGREVRKDQLERRLLLGSEWQGTDLIVERGDGGGIYPDFYSTRFARLAARVGLAGVRLHDIRHFYASELLRANVHPKVVSEGLGDASTTFTLDLYSHLLPSMQEQSSTAIEAALYGQERG